MKLNEIFSSMLGLNSAIHSAVELMYDGLQSIDAYQQVLNKYPAIREDLTLSLSNPSTSKSI